MSARDVSLRRQYRDLVLRHVAQPDEATLSEASQLGRDLLESGVPIEDLGELQHEAIVRLARKSPGTSLDQLGHLLTEPLVELLISYGVEFRRHQEEREETRRKLQAYSEELESRVEERTRDLAQREAELRRLVDELQRKDRAMDASLSAIALAQLDGELSYVNRSLVKLWGYEEAPQLLGSNLRQLLDADQQADELTQAIHSGTGMVGEVLARRADGSRFDAQMALSVFKGREGEPGGVLASFLDITERKQMQERLARSERLAIMGQLAGGVAHDLRNPLSAVKNAAYFLNMVLEQPEPEVQEVLGILEHEVARAERIIGNLLGFARPRPANLIAKINVNDVVNESLSGCTIPDNVQLELALDPHLPLVLSDPDQLAGAFENILLNGCQAMPDGGRMRVCSGVHGEQAEHVDVSFQDSGVGIPPEELDKIFEPLFTTKSKGIGLGLAITKTMVSAVNGTILVDSTPGEGTTFTVRIPVTAR